MTLWKITYTRPFTAKPLAQAFYIKGRGKDPHFPDIIDFTVGRGEPSAAFSAVVSIGPNRELAERIPGGKNDLYWMLHVTRHIALIHGGKVETNLENPE
ncbi:MAG: hypothetical protein QCH35_08445 [Methanomicrobiaceae archaeon]|nr:hypothetical protein [Methanomicrobiaceae archaeon]